MDPLDPIIPQLPEIPVVTGPARAHRADKDGRRERPARERPRRRAPADDLEALSAEGIYADLDVAGEDGGDDDHPHVDISA